MNGPIVGKAFLPGVGLCYVEEGSGGDVLVLRSIKTGAGYSRHRAAIQWRK